MLWQPAGRGRKRYRSREALEQTVAERVARAGVTGVVHTTVTEAPRLEGTTRWIVASVWVPLAAWHALVARLGWQVYVTNAATAHYSAPAVVAADHQHALEERGLSRLKTRNLPMRPVYLRDETRVVGLRWLWCLALRLLTLTEHRLRTALAERQEGLAGLNPASRTQYTVRPTTEHVLAAFTNMTLTTLRIAGGWSHHVTPLNATQRHILALLDLPDDLYERLARPSANFVLNLRE